MIVRRLLLGSATLVIVLATAWATARGLAIRRSLQVKVTATRMVDLYQLIQAESPPAVNSVTVASILEKYHRPQEWAKDRWSNPLLFERDSRTGKLVVISLGRDGKRGGCCQRWVTSLDDDAVYSGESWLQLWASTSR